MRRLFTKTILKLDSSFDGLYAVGLIFLFLVFVFGICFYCFCSSRSAENLVVESDMESFGNQQGCIQK